MANFRIQSELVGRIMILQNDDLQLGQLVDKVKKVVSPTLFYLMRGF